MKADANLTQNDKLGETSDSNGSSLFPPKADIIPPKYGEGFSDKGRIVLAKEESLTIAFQVFFPFLIAGIGTVSPGLLLDAVRVGNGSNCVAC